MVLGFTHKAIRGLTRASTVDAAVGLQAAIVVLIIEKKMQQANQYEIKRLVPALTRCTHGLIVMWSRRSYEEIPWANLRHGDGAYEVYSLLTKNLWYESDPNNIVEAIAARRRRDEDAPKRDG